MSKYASTFAGTGRVSRAAYYVVRAIVATATRLYTRMHIDGRERLPRTGAYVLAPVHRSYIDTPISSCLTRRRLRFMGKDSLWKYRASAWLLSSLGGFPVTRGTADREALKRCVAVLEAGEPLVLYPEGERKSGPVVQPLFDGAVYVALRAGVPIVPVGIGGSERVMPKDAKFIFPRKVHVVIGEPILPVATVGDSGRVARSAIRRHSDQLHATLQELFDEAMRRVGTPNEY
ncbi:lysophospholipid acyltransferase family protein [Desertimonas flava]|jgi:1-acyl-sn-glycerol-3-phosphate acyltransferase|uniref:lysophospholipid acyltransferase family protein n=1 Tax=Desertimonas flava TaxID=2064846 RepID=UPI000E3413F0|nr:lysophospholipid acyltransferase family protein [Desertimonas flava]